jgi:hypothetical protein
VVPTISRFHGIKIEMFFNEGFHPGRPHFHADHSGARAAFEIASLERLSGELPNRVERLVKAWAQIHREELLANWSRARTHQPLRQIDPLQN